MSDIQVAFAADLVTNDTDTSYNPDGKIDRIQNNLTWKSASNVVLPAGSIKWYVAPGYENDPNNPSTSNNGQGFEPNEPVTFAVPTGYDPLAATTVSTPFNVGKTARGFVWRNDAATPWPYLIRIRYRMHDSQGRVKSGDHVQGMWFEHIIQVQR